ncbi:NYN domain-containing protein [Halobaculum halobium]|uniref:NYN domain-containing protein n=1 Tax=Halobaculum halobium TaxID=3032281 RepID=A0ABD5TFD2_9EURY|nr:NYN domain-containing protein [Halobaculum sp. SYNS20]
MGLLDRVFGASAGGDDARGADGPSSAGDGAAGPRGPWRDADGEPARPRGVALFVDGPNVFRDEFDVDFADLRAAAEADGGLVTARLYLDEHATPGLIQAAEANGFQVITTSGDVDVKLAVDVASFAAERRAATVAIASRDTDFKPALEVANEYGLGTLAIAPGSYGRSDALRRSADEAVTLGE